MEQKEQFNKIYDEHLSSIFRFIYLKVETREMAEDLSAEVFIRFWNELVKMRQEIENIRSYLYKIARNVVADHYRARKVQMVSLSETTIELIDANFLHDQAAVNSDIEQIRKALIHLIEDYQDLIIWHYVEELSVPEIAQLTGKTESNVRVGLHRALKSLKDKLPVEAERV